MQLTIELQNLTEEQLHDTTGAMKNLEFILGTWQAVSGTDTYEWLEGHYFIQHSWSWDLGTMKFSGKEIIGYNPESHRYFANMYDNRGHFVSFDVILEGNILIYEGRLQKATKMFHNGKIDEKWISSKDGTTWVPLCEMTFSLLH